MLVLLLCLIFTFFFLFFFPFLVVFSCGGGAGRPVGCHASHRVGFAVSARPFGQRVSILTQGHACSGKIAAPRQANHPAVPGFKAAPA
ncbi:hypothetical protein I5P78_24040 [Serratia marcescens]|nr:hypothetical protein [Serratia marcescens]